LIAHTKPVEPPPITTTRRSRLNMVRRYPQRLVLKLDGVGR
jgi:hypothetical protein